jgi:hypothetical protein
VVVVSPHFNCACRNTPDSNIPAVKSFAIRIDLATGSRLLVYCLSAWSSSILAFW